MYRIVINGQETHYINKYGQFRLGRGAHNDLNLEEESISRDHLLLTLHPDYIMLEDNNSTFGTKLRPIKAATYQKLAPYQAKQIQKWELPVRLQLGNEFVIEIAEEVSAIQHGPIVPYTNPAVRRISYHPLMLFVALIVFFVLLFFGYMAYQQIKDDDPISTVITAATALPTYTIAASTTPTQTAIPNSATPLPPSTLVVSISTPIETPATAIPVPTTPEPLFIGSQALDFEILANNQQAYHFNASGQTELYIIMILTASGDRTNTLFPVFSDDDIQFSRLLANDPRLNNYPNSIAFQVTLPTNDKTYTVELHNADAVALKGILWINYHGLDSQTTCEATVKTASTAPDGINPRAYRNPKTGDTQLRIPNNSSITLDSKVIIVGWETTTGVEEPYVRIQSIQDNPNLPTVIGYWIREDHLTYEVENCALPILEADF